MTTLLQNRLNRLDQQDQAAENAYDKMAIDYGRNEMLFQGQPALKASWDARLANAGKTLEAIKDKNQKTREIIDAQLRPLERELGIPEPERLAERDVSKEFDALMKEKLEPSFYAYLTSSGIDANEIVRRAQLKGVTPEEYLNALIEARNRPVEEKPRQLSPEEMQQTWKERTKPRTPGKVEKTLKKLFPLERNY